MTTPPQPDPMEHNKELEEIKATVLRPLCLAALQPVENVQKGGLPFKTVEEAEEYAEIIVNEAAQRIDAVITALLNQEKDKVLDAVEEALPKVPYSHPQHSNDLDMHYHTVGRRSYRTDVKKALHNLRNSEIREG